MSLDKIFMLSAAVALFVFIAVVAVGIGLWATTYPPAWFFVIVGVSGAWMCTGAAVAAVLDA